MARYVRSQKNGSLEKFEEMKRKNPELTSEYEKKILAVRKGIEILQDPLKTRSETLDRMISVLDRLEERLTSTEFVCGSSYSLADCLFTCTLAR